MARIERFALAASLAAAVRDWNRVEYGSALRCMCVYTYTNTYVYTCTKYTFMCIYIYTYVYREREREREICLDLCFRIMYI